jgi:hypothetical protein
MGDGAVLSLSIKIICVLITKGGGHLIERIFIPAGNYFYTTVKTYVHLSMQLCC